LQAIGAYVAVLVTLDRYWWWYRRNWRYLQAAALALAIVALFNA